jgi:hypothetical protein
VRVTEHAVMWKEEEASLRFSHTKGYNMHDSTVAHLADSFQGLPDAHAIGKPLLQSPKSTEVDKSWTVMSSTYNHLRDRRGSRKILSWGSGAPAAGSGRLPVTNVESTEGVSTIGATVTVVQEESAVNAPPVFQSAGAQARSRCTQPKALT